MSETICKQPTTETSHPGVAALTLDVRPEGHRSVVRLTGELDLATRRQLIHVATAGDHPNVVIDLTDLTFIDCCGYGALLQARYIVERSGRAMTVTGQTGEPARLINQIETHSAR